MFCKKYKERISNLELQLANELNYAAIYESRLAKLEKENKMLKKTIDELKAKNNTLESKVESYYNSYNIADKKYLNLINEAIDYDD